MLVEFVLYGAPAAALCAGFVGFKIGRGRKLVEKTALDDLGRDLPTLLIDYENVKRQRDEHFAKIEEVIAERETWRELYNDQSGGHENAQALMFETISKLVFIYKRDTGKEPKINPLIKTVMQDWGLEHGKEARAQRGDDGQRPATEDKQPS